MKKLKFDSRLVNYLLCALIGLLLLGSLLGANEVVGLLSKKANTLVGIKAQQQAVSTEQSKLVIAKKEVSKYASLESVSQSIVPQDKNQAATVQEIVSIAQASGVPITQIIFPLSTLGESVTAPVASAGPAPASPNLSLSQLVPVKGIPGVYVLSIEVEDSEVQQAVTYQAFYNFLTKLEQNRRTSEVTALSLSPDPSNTNLLTFTLTINEYIKPQ